MTTRLSTKPFDEAAYLDTKAGVAAFLADAFESGDDEVFQEALQADAQPRFATVRKVMTALGVKLAVVTVKKAATARRAPGKQTRASAAKKPASRTRAAAK